MYCSMYCQILEYMRIVDFTNFEREWYQELLFRWAMWPMGLLNLVILVIILLMWAMWPMGFLFVLTCFGHCCSGEQCDLLSFCNSYFFCYYLSAMSITLTWSVLFKMALCYMHYSCICLIKTMVYLCSQYLWEIRWLYIF